MTSQIGRHDSNSEEGIKMTVGENSAGASLQSKVNRDILFKQLWQKPTVKGRREGVNSAGSSFPCHISRKLLLEEHKLDVQLQQIEKERKLFLSKNSNEKYMLQLSVRTSRTSAVSRRNSGQCLLLNENARGNLLQSSSDHKHLTEGNEINKKSRSSTTNGVFCQSGANSVRQLQRKKVCPLRKMAERNRTANSLPWRRNYDIPPVPPPSPIPSKTNIIWVRVRVRNSAGDLEVDSFLRTSKSSQDMLLEEGKVTKRNERNISPRRRENDTGIQDSKLPADTSDSVFEDPFVDDYTIPRWLDNCSAQSEPLCYAEPNPAWLYDHEAPNASPIQHEVLGEKLEPTVKGLKVSTDEVRRSPGIKQKFEEKPKNYKPQHDDGRYPLKVSLEKNSRARNGPGRKPADDIGNDRLDIVTDLQKDLEIVTDRKKIGKDLKIIGCQNVASNQVNIVSERSIVACDRRSIASDREKIGTDSSEIGKDREIIGPGWQDIAIGRSKPSDSKNKTKRKTRQIVKSSSTKVNKRKTVQKCVEPPENIQEIRVFAKTFIIRKRKCKKKTGRKTPVSGKKCFSKANSATCINDKKISDTKLPRKSCSACTVMFETKDATPRPVESKGIRSTPENLTCKCINEGDIPLQIAGEGESCDSGTSQSPAPIMLPSPLQLENFDKVAKKKLRKSLEVKMRRNYYTGSWAFQPTNVNVKEVDE